MKEKGAYDSETQMFVEQVKIPKINTLRSLRWAADQGLYGHYPLSMPRGDFLLALTDTEIINFVAKDNKRKEVLPVEPEVGLH